MLDKKKLNKLGTIFKYCGPLFIALGDENRQKLIMDIGSYEAEGGVNVSTLASMTDLSRPAISHHLKVLKDCGFIKSRKKGTQIFYSLSLNENVKKMEELIPSIQSVLLEIESVSQSS